ncbi:MAG: T9SS type A sorting domain-containing protein [Bacteroidota bacterium]
MDSTRCAGSDLVFSCLSPELVGSEEEYGVTFTLPPNPTNHSLHIECSEYLQNMHYSMYTIQGEAIQVGKISTSQILDVSELPSGLYMLSISEPRIKAFINTKFVKN